MSASAPTGYQTRRTFAIISHPDAGKTTLTEKLLLNSGAIHLAGEVKERGERRRTRSDWMEIEQKRGISITSSVMTFEHDGLTLNLLDTPGHADFSEDTYRTLTAVDSAIMVLDAAKGIEAQTRKLFEVCRMRDIPIITFVNKIDREARDTLEILDEIMETLALDTVPMMWPVGAGVDFSGMIDLERGRFVAPDGQPEAQAPGVDAIASRYANSQNRQIALAMEGLELASGSLPQFDRAAYEEGTLTPVYFGSALKSIGVRELLEAVCRFAPPPRIQPAAPTPVDPGDPACTGFVFKVQANMDPNHRDRVAFVRVASGTLKRGMRLKNVRSGKDLKVANPMFFFARERELADEAVAGDVVGIPNHGTLSVGDTLTDGADVTVTGIPNFAPELLRRVHLSDASKTKQLAKALNDLAEEGVVQVFKPTLGAGYYVGAVGPLQLEVLTSRAQAEYGVQIRIEPAQYVTARWVKVKDKTQFEKFSAIHRLNVAEDRYGDPVFLAPSQWEIDRCAKDYPELTFLATKDRGITA
ncbi:peptide chain release factor 3 [Pelagibacterium lacus]|uniref:Peptide chain release factor 3 n=1 Tax=Pelagibacterium lacus TaxID=2282655 RepID=A0A369W485_9HYPH|nr:peptide chain release factor 3 [Pelagibacterium lacus]RDE09504.1 peptide chain release factor 3 [Pelagibacterium lacus]